MQSGQDRPDYPTVDNHSTWSETESGEGTSTAVSALEPYVPPNVPHGLPHVVRFATLSSMDLRLDVRFLIIMLARFAYDDLKRPAYTASGRRFFSRRLSNPLLVRKDALSLPQLRKLAAPLRNPRVRGIGGQ